MTTPTPRWTAETLALATSAFEDWALSRTEVDDLWDKPADAARAVLTALADAGVLMPVGGETWQEFGTRIGNGDILTLAEAGTRYTLSAQSRRVRTVVTGPWREVTDDPA